MQSFDRSVEGKLETKSFEQARLYFNMEDYKAAVTAFRNLLNDFPSTSFRENSLFLIVKSEFLLAENSIDEKNRNVIAKPWGSTENSPQPTPKVNSRRRPTISPVPRAVASNA